MPHYTKEQLARSKFRHEAYTKIISDFHLEDRAFYWIKEKQEDEDDDSLPETWRPSQCFICIEMAGIPTRGNIYSVYFSTIGSDWGRDYEDIILGPKIEIGEPPT